MDTVERNRLANVYRKELAGKIGSPFRIKVYIDARISGKTVEQAMQKALNKSPCQ